MSRPFALLDQPGISEAADWVLGFKEPSDHEGDDELPPSIAQHFQIGIHEVPETDQPPSIVCLYTVRSRVPTRADLVAADIWSSGWRLKPKDQPAAWEACRKRAGAILTELHRPASQQAIAGELLTLCEILDQSLPKATGMFIINLLWEGKLPFGIVKRMCDRVARFEARGIKPVSFAKLIKETMEDRLSTLRIELSCFRAIWDNFDPALEVLHRVVLPDEQMAESAAMEVT